MTRDSRPPQRSSRPFLHITHSESADTVMQAASPPSSEESELYYLGLPSVPRLVARSSTHAWERPETPGFSTYTDTADGYRKSLWPADRDPRLHQLWNDAESSLRVQILEAVNIAPSWTAIDILRIGLNGKFDTTLLVSVKPGSLTWSRAHPITLRCKHILEEHGIRNIECEIRESVVSLYGNTVSKVESAAASDTTSQLQLSSAPITDFSGTITVATHVDLSDCIGTKISMRGSDTRSGTKGLYLALSPSPSTAAQVTRRIVALTGRHVVIDTKTDVQEYMYRHVSQPAREAIQIEQPTYHKLLRDFEESAVQYSDAAEEQRNIGRDDYAAVYDQGATGLADLADKMRPYTAPSSRVFGRLLFSPKFAFAPSQTNRRGDGQWLRDWALIELLPGSHQAPLGALSNKIFVGHEFSIMGLLDKSPVGWAGLPRPKPLAAINGTVELANHYVPMNELIYPPHCTEYDDKPAMFVVQYGAKSGLKVGLGNTLTSIVRVEGHMKGYSEEWAIISVTWAVNRQVAFSEKGDSGSCVFDMKGRPAGIIMAGNENNKLNDITYAQPLERLIGDIKAHGFDVSLI